MTVDLASALFGALLLAGMTGAVIWQLPRKALRHSEEALAASEQARAISEAAGAQAKTSLERLEAEFQVLTSTHTALTNELSALKARAEERERSLREQLEQAGANRQQLRTEFENLSREFLSARDRELREANGANIGAILKPLAEKIDGFQHRVNQVHGEMLQNTSALGEQIRSLEKVGLAISTDATNLTRALKGDKKLVGNWGEAQLERTLEMAGLQAGEHYETQRSFKNDEGQRLVPDLVIRLPGGKHIVVDSKVSLVDYEAAVSADNDDQRDAALKRHSLAIKAHIDSLAAKDYAHLAGMESPDFVLMFMPVEPAYIEVMKQHRELFSYGYQKGVVMVSHTTLMPILRTISNLWMVERSNAEAREISDRAGEIYNAVSLVAERLESLGSTLQTATRKYNDTVTAVVGRQGLHGKVDRFQQLSQKANRPFPSQLSALPDNNDAHQLGVARNAGDDPSP